MLHVAVSGGTAAGKRAPRHIVHTSKEWTCPGCSKANAYFWRTCPNCGTSRPY